MFVFLGRHYLTNTSSKDISYGDTHTAIIKRLKLTEETIAKAIGSQEESKGTISILILADAMSLHLRRFVI